jgi:hypothetical protein
MFLILLLAKVDYHAFLKAEEQKIKLAGLVTDKSETNVKFIDNLKQFE